MMVGSVFGVEGFDELVLEEPVAGSSSHVFEEEQHAIEELEFLFIEEAKLESACFVPDIDDVVLLFSDVLDPFELRDIEFGQFAIEGQVLVEFYHSCKNCVPVFEL